MYTYLYITHTTKEMEMGYYVNIKSTLNKKKTRNVKKMNELNTV